MLKTQTNNIFYFFFSSRRRHTRWPRDWSSDVCSSDLFHARLGGQRRALDIDRRGVHGKISSLQEAQASRDAPQPLLSDQRVATRWNRDRGVGCVDQESSHRIDPEAEPPILDVQASVERLPADRRPFHEGLVGWLMLAPVALDHHQGSPGAAAQQTERQGRPDLVSEAGPCVLRLVLVHALLLHPSHSPGASGLPALKTHRRPILRRTRA